MRRYFVTGATGFIGSNVADGLHVGGFEVLYTEKLCREGETLLKRIISNIWYSIISLFSEMEIPRDTENFQIISRRVNEEITTVE